MTLGTIIAAIAIEQESLSFCPHRHRLLSAALYMVPALHALQHRAPKASKGEVVSTSNFINVTAPSSRRC